MDTPGASPVNYPHGKWAGRLWQQTLVQYPVCHPPRMRTMKAFTHCHLVPGCPKTYTTTSGDLRTRYLVTRPSGVRARGVSLSVVVTKEGLFHVWCTTGLLVGASFDGNLGRPGCDQSIQCSVWIGCFSWTLISEGSFTFCVSGQPTQSTRLDMGPER